jgi:4-amino-4-deoxy-L-arabinose transferase-like glycosyltransferase
MAIFAAATVPRLAHRGMFVDGITYASIARNLAQGRGSFWTPSYTATVYPQFHQHPPLGLWLQSMWFRALGDHLYVERAYSLAAAAATAVLIALIWRRVNAGTPAERDEWLPVLLWILIPLVSWSIVGNLLETTVTLFTTAAVAALVRTTMGGSRMEAGWAVASGLCIVAAVLTKGPVGLFPLAAPIIMLNWHEHRTPWRAVAIQWSTVTGCAVLLWNVPSARAALLQYSGEQLMPALTGSAPGAAHSWTIVKVLLQGVWLPLGLASIILIACAVGWDEPSAKNRFAGLRFCLLGLAGTLPILVSAKQMGHYLVPAVPFFALAAAVILSATARRIADRVASRRGAMVILALCVSLVVGTAAAAVMPALERDPERLADLASLAPNLPRDRTIGICYEASGDWGLHAWFERLFAVGLDATTTGQSEEWFLKTGLEHGDCPPARCTPVTDIRRRLVLMQCRKR